mmetsp:Transcript_90792/g.189810  ORF Transcript_90792/g.189810 Transcript_90792/m.189810 type:complete len:335 (-) Transcript_90792:269-1273(-)|eukprot:CAMPEP_0206481218 /NCGR_PEP_ID=MMETSP0324_2-20121206/38001_1 /ASSEMBLY_ACC=CAM_ASM_000836 /TAXON_ID=2866 /ORGANISM="Crypthecodinium cohnii, Strain Seligo" /LENGTH=334 /DNA_ID=CAMNT_0053958639 /DNA_START=401 /DNA_END=1405 /DNA_ORIENTATION=-
MGKGSKDAKGKGSSSKQTKGAAPTGGDKTAPTSTLACGLKFLASEPLVAALIGKGGSVISNLRTTCKARLSFSEYGDVYPGTELRVLIAQASEEAHLNLLIEQLLGKLGEVAEEGEDTENTGTSEEMKIRVLVPRSAAGSLIGKGGANIKELREASNTKVSIADATMGGPQADQVVYVAGEEEGIKEVLTQINHHIQSNKDESWFQAWATTAGTVPWNLSNAGGSAGSNSNLNPGIDLMMRVAKGLPPYVVEDSRGFALSCVVPSHLVGGLIGRGGAGTREIQALTGANIGIRDIEDDADNRALHIFGPLPATCAAYMLMMKRYLDVEQSASSW